MIYTGKFLRAEIYHNTTGKSPEQIKKEKGCTAIINGILFNGDGSLCCDVRINGKWIANDAWTYWGLGWSDKQVPNLVHTNNAENYDNFLSCVLVSPTIRRGRSAIGFKDNTYTVLCVSDGASDAMTTDAVAKTMELRCDRYLILDGGGSSYLDCPAGIIDANYYRKIWNRTYILIWEDTAQKEEKKEIFRVQLGAFKNKDGALSLLNKIRKLEDTINAGYKNAYVRLVDNLYKVQVGAFSKKENAEKLINDLASRGYKAFISNK